MSFMTRDEFIQQQESKTKKFETNEARALWNFRIKEDGGEAIVRFFYTDPSQFEVFTVHPGNADTKWKKINCVNDLKEGITDCPLCAAGLKLQSRFFVKLIEYVRNEDGTVTPYCRIWDRPASFMQILTNLFTEYGDISDCIFKVKRRGSGLDTEYDIMYANPTVYNSQIYPKDFTPFEGYEILGNNILNKTKIELGVMAREATNFENVEPKPVTQVQEQQAVQGVTLSSSPRKVVY